ncbi:hypothetical protein K443DRAFT_99843, partial [Laccaria amethystina LaAM-08-1]
RPQKITVCSIFAVRSGFFGFWERADWLRLRLKPLSIKKPDQTRLDFQTLGQINLCCPIIFSSHPCLHFCPYHHKITTHHLISTLSLEYLVIGPHIWHTQLSLVKSTLVFHTLFVSNHVLVSLSSLSHSHNHCFRRLSCPTRGPVILVLPILPPTAESVHLHITGNQESQLTLLSLSWRTIII